MWWFFLRPSLEIQIDHGISLILVLWAPLIFLQGGYHRKDVVKQIFNKCIKRHELNQQMFGDCRCHKFRTMPGWRRNGGRWKLVSQGTCCLRIFYEKNRQKKIGKVWESHYDRCHFRKNICDQDVFFVFFGWVKNMLKPRLRQTSCWLHLSCQPFGHNSPTFELIRNPWTIQLQLLWSLDKTALPFAQSNGW